MKCSSSTFSIFIISSKPLSSPKKLDSNIFSSLPESPISLASEDEVASNALLIRGLITNKITKIATIATPKPSDMRNISDFVKPKKKMTLTAFEEPSLKEIQDILN